MDEFNKNPYEEKDNPVSEQPESLNASKESTEQPATPEQPTQAGSPYENPFTSGSGNPYANQNNPYLNQGNPYANQNPYGNQNPYANQNPYTNQNSDPYGSENPANNPNPYATQYNPYTTGGYVEPPKQKGLGMGIASMVLGIVSIVFCCIWYIGLICSIIGLILGIISRVKSKNGFALAGIITSSFGIAFGLLMLFAEVSLILNGEDFWNDFYDSNFGDSSSGNHNNNAIISALRFIKNLFVK